MKIIRNRDTGRRFRNSATGKIVRGDAANCVCCGEGGCESFLSEVFIAYWNGSRWCVRSSGKVCVEIDAETNQPRDPNFRNWFAGGWKTLTNGSPCVMIAMPVGPCCNAAGPDYQFTPPAAPAGTPTCGCDLEDGDVVYMSQSVVASASSSEFEAGEWLTDWDGNPQENITCPTYQFSQTGVGNSSLFFVKVFNFETCDYETFLSIYKRETVTTSEGVRHEPDPDEPVIPGIPAARKCICVQGETRSTTFAYQPGDQSTWTLQNIGPPGGLGSVELSGEVSSTPCGDGEVTNGTRSGSASLTQERGIRTQLSCEGLFSGRRLDGIATESLSYTYSERHSGICVLWNSTPCP